MGNDTGYVLEISCPYGTEAIATDILAKVQGKKYKGFRAENAILPPDAELGDYVNVNYDTYPLAYMKTTCGPGHMSDIAAPGENTPEHEYSWVSPEKKEFEKKLSGVRSEIAKSANEIKLGIYGEGGLAEQYSLLSVALDGISMVVSGDPNDENDNGLVGQYSAISQKVNNISLSVSSSKGSTTFTLTANGAELSAQTLNLSVDAVNVTGKLTAQNVEVEAAAIKGQLKLDNMASISFGNLSDSTTIAGNIQAAYNRGDAAYALAEKAQLPSNITSTYIDNITLRSPTIEANDIGLHGGYFVVKDSAGSTTYGSIGYGTGNDGVGSNTTGVVMSSGDNTGLDNGNYYMIVTNKGARMQAGQYSIYVTSNGCYTSNGTTYAQIGTCVFG